MLQKFSGFILYVLITILVISLYAGKYGFLDNFDLRMQDGMFKLRGDIAPRGNIVIVGIDERSLDQMGKWPWTQDKLARLISNISSESPKVVVLDIFLPENIDEDTSGRTELLANEIRHAGNVILPIYFNLSEVGMTPTPSPPAVQKSALGRANGSYLQETASAKQLFFPDKLLLQSALEVGHINVVYDPDGLIRGEPTLIEYDGYLYPSLGLQTAKRYLNLDRKQFGLMEEGTISLGGIRIPTDKKSRMMINYHGPNLTFQHISALDVLNGEAPPKVFSGKIVLVALTAIEAKMWARVPVYGTLNEVERIANVIENMVQHNFLIRLSPIWNLLTLILIGIFCALVLPKVSLTYRVVILLVFLFVMFNLNYILFSSFGILTKPFYPILEVLLFLSVAPIIKVKSLKLEEVWGKTLGVEEIYPEEKRELTHGLTERHGEQSREQVQTKVLARIPSPEKPESVFFESRQASTPVKIVTKEKRKEEETITIPAPAQDTSRSGLEETGKGALRKSTSHLSSTQFGRYKILELIGKGGMGAVHKGLDPVLDRLVALKTIRSDSPLSGEEASELKERLLREAKAAGNLSHPNIVTIYDVGEQEGLQYIAMEYLSGYTLEGFIRKKKKLNYRVVAKILMQVCAALNYAHQRGIVHRDIKPANIMLLEGFVVKVMDFGIAKLQTSSLTQKDVTLGTPHYISPEQLEGKLADKRSDIFSLGVVIYELLTGEKPFRGESISSLMYAILNYTPPPPSALNEKTPLVFDRIVSKAMAKNPEERYQDTDEIEKTLREFISSFVVTRSVRI